MRRHWYFHRRSIVWFLCVFPTLLGVDCGQAAEVQAAPQAFRQEVARRWPLPAEVASGGLRALDIGPSGEVRVTDGTRWLGISDDRLQAVAASEGWAAKPAGVRQWVRDGGAVWLVTPDGVQRWAEGQGTALDFEHAEVRQMAVGSGGLALAAAADGLWRRASAGTWDRVRVEDGQGRLWADRDVRGVAIDGRGEWWVATPAGVARKRGEAWEFYTGREGLPYADFTGVAAGSGGEVWFGTRRGLVRFDGTDWAYRQGPRWLPGDEVRALAPGEEGQLWVVTDGGLGCLERRPMTMAEKAAHYEVEIEKYIKRTPFGYTSEVGLGAPGDRSKIIYSDSDNDGLWTAMYGAGECFAYAATRNPAYQRRAQSAFEALRFLQKVTQGGPHSPPKGYVARTIRPADWPDPNVGRIEGDRENQRRHDRLWKVYEPRWPKSADGQWYWKSDTSSDELDGHYFFYAAYFEHVAQTEAERERVQEVVRDLTDHLVTHDFALVDHDGRPTRWAVFGPKWLNHDPDWWVERGLNSLSMLSYLAVAEAVTGDPKYGRAARELIDVHGYGAHVMNPKTQMGLGSGNQSDDEMGFMCFYNLLRYSKEAVWREKWRFAFHAYWALEQPERNPFFHFAYAASGLGRTYTNAFGSTPIAPWDGWLEDAMGTLRGFPLDRANWPHQNSHRLDLVWLTPQQTEDLASMERQRRAGRVNGKVLPVEERHFNHWNTDPWQLNYGGDGRELGSGTVFLLPYYMGLYHGFIERPAGAGAR